ncbi:MAG TPA: ADOP family duplicated permease, partial [Longimicrobiales bacterium]|nr:ADOP family duplicated permease [Longimicrobiales bacterium]
ATRPADGVDGMPISLHDYRDFRAQQTSFESLQAGYAGTINLGGEEGPPERFQGGFVTAGMLGMLGVAPLHGRTFAEGDDRPGAPALLLLGHDAWRTRFDADPGVVGRTVRVNGELATVIGVMPAGFRFPLDEDIWVPLRVDVDAVPRGTGTPVIAAGYLRPGVSREAAAAEMAAIAARIETEHPEQNRGVSADVAPYTDAFMPPQIVTMMGLLMAMVLGVLVVACANVANVLMARAVVREKEVAIRSALGARRGRVIRQLLAEAVALGVAGGIVGVGVAWIALRLFNQVLGDVQKPYWIEFVMDGPTLLFTSLLTLAAAVLAGTVPALRASGGALSTTLRDESRGSSSLRVGRFSTALVIGELAVSCGLMIGAGLLIRSLVDMNRLDLGFQTEQVMTSRLGLFETDYPDAEARNRFYHLLLERLESEPGVRSAALATGLPALGQGRSPIQVDGESYGTDADIPGAGTSIVSAGFFETFGVRALEGRELRSEDTRIGAEPVALVNRSFVQKRLGGRGAIGRRIRMGGVDTEQPWMRIVGVVPDLHQGVGPLGGGNQLPEAIYLPLGLADPRFISIALHTQGPPAGITPGLRRAVADVDPNLPLYWVRTMSEAMAESTFMHRIFGTLFGIFGAAALFLAAVGLYGVIDFSVSARLREMGLRMALGAEGGSIMRMVFGRVFRQVAIGVTLGLVLGALLARPLAATMFGVESWDPLVYAVIVGTLVLTAAAAALRPALRAVRVDPVVALRA